MCAYGRGVTEDIWALLMLGKWWYQKASPTLHIHPTLLWEKGVISEYRWGHDFSWICKSSLFLLQPLLHPCSRRDFYFFQTLKHKDSMGGTRKGGMLEQDRTSWSQGLAPRQCVRASICLWGSGHSLTNPLNYTFGKGRWEVCTIHLITTLPSSEVWNKFYL